MRIKIKTWKTEDGRSWVGEGSLGSGAYSQVLQCAACLEQQWQTDLERKNGIVDSYEMKERHLDDCIQKPLGYKNIPGDGL